MILESCRSQRGEQVRFETVNMQTKLFEIIKLSVASFKTARFEDGSWKSGRGIWLFVWRVFEPELTNTEAVQRETRRHLVTYETEWRTHVELLDGGSATLVGSDDLNLHDLDGVGASAMASSHIPI